MDKQIQRSSIDLLQAKAYDHMKFSSVGDKTHFSIITPTNAKNPWYEKVGFW
jgi:hypothetical protein